LGRSALLQRPLQNEQNQKEQAFGLKIKSFLYLPFSLQYA